ncbi:MAG: hypothetical protein JWR26_1825 [Pedosphaera sp.]|nr:hypothetical protein [Pedosphaera sp.]
MKMMLLAKASVLSAGLLFVACAGPASAGVTTAAKEKTCSGTITAVSASEKIVKVQSFLFNKTFVVGDNCSMTGADARQATLADLRAGQKVEIRYKDAGVLIANRISQEKLSLSGEVQMIDREAHVLRVRDSSGAKTMRIVDNCPVLLIGDNRGTLEDVKLGNRVTVVYESPGGQFVARRIEQKSVLFVGILDGINARDRTLSLGKKFLGDKRFHLADRCPIVIDGKSDAKLSDLRLGQRYELSYENVDGVNVANRVALVEMQDDRSVPRQTARSTALGH